MYKVNRNPKSNFNIKLKHRYEGTYIHVRVTHTGSSSTLEGHIVCQINPKINKKMEQIAIQSFDRKYT